MTDGTDGDATGDASGNAADGAPPRSRKRGAAKAPRKSAAPRPAKGAPKPRGVAKARAEAAEAARWTRFAGLMLFGALALRLALNAWTVIPVHFDEAQYWVYGQNLAFGYYSKPPLIAWAIRAATEAFGDSLFGLRAAAPAAHFIAGGFVFAVGARLWDARCGFWAAALYTAAPGVNVSALLMTTDPLMMAFWAAALYALVRAMEGAPPARGPSPAIWRPGWWAAAGACVGLAMLAKYTAVAFPLGLAGYALMSRAGPAAPAQRRGAWLALGVGLAVLAPNLAWNAAEGFATVRHLGESGSIERGAALNLSGLAGFLAGQAAVFGPVGLVALVAGALAAARAGDWRDRLLLWLIAPLLAVMAAQATIFKAEVNWAAPIYVAGSVLAARWMLGRGWARALRLHAAIGAASVALLWGAAVVYATWGTEAPRFADPFKKMRAGGPFCEIALSAYEGEGAEALLMDDRRRLSECMFIGGLTLADVAMFDADGTVSNHFELRAPLRAGDARVMLLAVQSDVRAAEIAALFAAATPLASGRIALHRDRDMGYALWLVEGYRGP